MLFLEVPRGSQASAPVAPPGYGPPLLPAPTSKALPTERRRLPVMQPIKLEYISASALERFSPLFEGGCYRKWFAEKGDRYERVQTEAAKLGTAVHDQHEAWLKFGKPYDRTTKAGQIAAESLHLLPPPGTGTVEGEARFEYDGITFLVKIDLHWAEGVSHSACKAIVLDHKTTGRDEFVKDTKAKLLAHPQAPLYAVWAMRRYRTAYAELRWNYVTTRKPYTPMPSWHMTIASEVQEIMRQVIVPEAKKMIALVAHANSERAAGRPFTMFDIPINASTRHPQACNAFGGCPRKELCQITGIEEFDIMSQPLPQMPQFVQSLFGQGAVPGQAPTPVAPQGYDPNQPGYPTQQAPQAPPGWGQQAPQGFAPPQAPAAPAPAGFGPPAGFAPPPAQQAPQAPQGFAPPQPPPAQTFVPPPGAQPGPVPGYGQAINPPEAGTPGAPVDTDAKRKRRTKAEIAAAQGRPGGDAALYAAEAAALAASVPEPDTVSPALLALSCALAGNPNVQPQNIANFAKQILTELEKLEAGA